MSDTLADGDHREDTSSAPVRGAILGNGEILLSQSPGGIQAFRLANAKERKTMHWKTICTRGVKQQGKLTSDSPCRPQKRVVRCSRSDMFTPSCRACFPPCRGNRWEMRVQAPWYRRRVPAFKLLESFMKFSPMNPEQHQKRWVVKVLWSYYGIPLNVQHFSRPWQAANLPTTFRVASSPQSFQVWIIFANERAGGARKADLNALRLEATAARAALATERSDRETEREELVRITF